MSSVDNHRELVKNCRALQKPMKPGRFLNLSNIKPIKKFDGSDIVCTLPEDQSKIVFQYENSGSHMILASLLEWLCNHTVKDKKESELLFKKISHFLIERNLLHQSNAIEEFRGLRANIRQIFYQFVTDPKMVTAPILTMSEQLTFKGRYDAEFDEIGKLGKGGFGSVHEAVNKLDGRHYAIKKIRFRANQINQDITKTLQEVKTLAKLKHPNIVGYNSAWLEYNPPSLERSLSDEDACSDDSLYSESTSSPRSQRAQIKELESMSTSSSERVCSETVIDLSSSDSLKEKPNSMLPVVKQSSCFDSHQSYKPNTVMQLMEHWNTLYIQMELCQETLQDWLHNRNNVQKPEIDIINPIDNLKIFKGLLTGIAFIHSKGIIHRDIKPANIFLKRNFLVKIGDFGLATENCHSNMEVDFTKGKDKHLSRGVGTLTYSAPEQINSSIYDTKSDIYSLGLILYELFHPFTTESERLTLFIKLKKDYEISDLVKENYADRAELIKKMVKENPLQRLSAEDILNQDLLPTKDDIIKEQTIEIERLRSQVNELTLQLQTYKNLERRLKEKRNVLDS